MIDNRLDDMSLNDIMRRWPRTVAVFVDMHLHCIGCPIADFHQLADAATEHGVSLAALEAAIRVEIDRQSISASALRGRQR